MPSAIASTVGGSSKNAILDSAPSTIPPLFQQAQHSLANHRKNIVSLYRIHHACSQISEQTTKGTTRLLGEKEFNRIFLSCLDRILGLKRGISNADRVIRFVASYCTYAQENFRAEARKALKESGDEMDEDDEEEDTTATRFVGILMKHLLGGFNAKDKNVRLRCCQAVGLLIGCLESIDDHQYEKLKSTMLLRANDKEPSVRVQAVIALSKLCSGEEEEGNIEASGIPKDDSSITISEALKQLLRHDPSAEVRRAALFNLQLTQKTLPDILERRYDVDTLNRRCLYLGKLSNSVLDGPDCRIKITPNDWSSLVDTGMGDREPSVVKAIKKLISSWVNIDGGKDEVEKLLTRFDVISIPEAASRALEAAFESRPALLDTLAFENDFWEDLTPEKAFSMRVFAKHCKDLGAIGERRMEETMPPVTALAFRIQAAWGKYVEQEELKRAGESFDENALRAYQSILQSLLHVSLNLDYGDEIGRRRMFGLVRELVSGSLLPEPLINECLDVLRKLSAGEKDFIRIIVEVAQEIEDVLEPLEANLSDDSDDEAMIEGQLLGESAKEVSMSSEEREEQAKIDARRLAIVKGLLERIVGGVQENTVMQGLVSQLIAPAVKSKSSIVRRQGLVCLGLFALLDPQLAQNAYNLFLQQIEATDPDIRSACLKIVFDNLIQYGILFLCQSQIEAMGTTDSDSIEMVRTQMVNYLLNLLEDEDVELQAIAAEGMAKLMLSGVVEDDDALRSLILVYYSPETSDNEQLRQCLTYVLPAYCSSSSTCQRKLQRMLSPTLEVLTEVYFECDDDQDMVTPFQIGLQLLDWSDPSKGTSSSTMDKTIHIDVAIEFLQYLIAKGTENKENRKVICQLFSKLNLPEEREMQLSCLDSPELGSDDASMTTDGDFVPLAVLLTLMGTLKKVHSIDKWDASSRNNLNKFQLNCKAKYANVWERVRAMNPMEAIELQGLRAYLAEECGLEVEEVIDIGDDGTMIPKQQKKPTSSSSSISKRSGTTSRVTSGSTSRKASIVRIASIVEDEGGATARAARKSYVPVVIDSESEEEEDDATVLGPTIKVEEDNQGDDNFDVL